MKPGKDYIGTGCWSTIINDKEETLLLKRKGNDIWERPGGKLEHGESLKNCAIRESKEETGVEISVECLLNIGETIEDKTHWIAIGYLCKYKSGEANLIEDTKHDDVKWFPIGSLPKLTPHTQNAINIYLNKRNKT